MEALFKIARPPFCFCFSHKTVCFEDKQKFIFNVSHVSQLPIARLEKSFGESNATRGEMEKKPCNAATIEMT